MVFSNAASSKNLLQSYSRNFRDRQEIVCRVYHNPDETLYELSQLFQGLDECWRYRMQPCRLRYGTRKCNFKSAHGFARADEDVMRSRHHLMLVTTWQRISWGSSSWLGGPWMAIDEGDKERWEELPALQETSEEEDDCVEHDYIDSIKVQGSTFLYKQSGLPDILVEQEPEKVGWDVHISHALVLHRIWSHVCNKTDKVVLSRDLAFKFGPAHLH